MTTASVSVTVDVDVDLSEIDIEDLIDELHERRARGETNAEYDPIATATEIYELFYLGKDEQAIAKTKEFVQNVTGRILP